MTDDTEGYGWGQVQVGLRFSARGGSAPLRGWLQGFASHIALSPAYFFIAGVGALLIAWGTVLSHALRVARANPIHALRTE